VELQGKKDAFAKRGLGLAAVSRDPAEITAPFAERKGITYPLLSDAGSAVIRRYGLLNTQVAPDNAHFGIPFPGTFVLDAEGRVADRFFEESYRTRMTGNTLALELGADAGAAPDTWATTARRAGEAWRASSDQLEVTVHPSDPVVAPGQEFTIVLDVVMKPGVHVYAPGGHPYRPIRLTLEPDSLFSGRDAIYPESEDYHFKPLDEHVPVFTGAFRVRKPVAIEASRELAARAREPGAAVTLRGTLEYQACDATVCFLPQSVPFRLTLGLRPLEK
jgi:hypothetical protein